MNGKIGTKPLSLLSEHVRISQLRSLEHKHGDAGQHATHPRRGPLVGAPTLRPGETSLDAEPTVSPCGVLGGLVDTGHQLDTDFSHLWRIFFMRGFYKAKRAMYRYRGGRGRGRAAGGASAGDVSGRGLWGAYTRACIHT